MAGEARRREGLESTDAISGVDLLIVKYCSFP